MQIMVNVCIFFRAIFPPFVEWNLIFYLKKKRDFYTKKYRISIHILEATKENVFSPSIQNVYGKNKSVNNVAWRCGCSLSKCFVLRNSLWGIQIILFVITVVVLVIVLLFFVNFLKGFPSYCLSPFSFPNTAAFASVGVVVLSLYMEGNGWTQ